MQFRYTKLPNSDFIGVEDIFEYTFWPHSHTHVFVFIYNVKEMKVKK